mmetsp:Transcript_13986/g.30243  ORF Transcript_13986/g.30243 Transcript_13986/m.30243 type:complete len:133 (-) Transcript_13986:463-861(-)
MEHTTQIWLPSEEPRSSGQLVRVVAMAELGFGLIHHRCRSIASKHSAVQQYRQVVWAVHTACVLLHYHGSAWSCWSGGFGEGECWHHASSLRTPRSTVQELPTRLYTHILQGKDIGSADVAGTTAAVAVPAD